MASSDPKAALPNHLRMQLQALETNNLLDAEESLQVAAAVLQHVGTNSARPTPATDHKNAPPLYQQRGI